MSPWTLLRRVTLTPAWRSVKTATWGENARSLAMLAGFVGFLGLLNAIFNPILKYFWTQEAVGEVLIRALIYFLFLALSVLTVFSSVISMSGRFFTAPDADLFLSRPLNEETYFRFRYWQGTLATSWMLLPFWAPLIFSLKHASGASLGFFFWSLLAPLPLGWIACSLGTVIVMLASRRFSAKRMRGGFGVAAALMAVGLVFLLRVIQPERLTRPDSAATLQEFLKTWSPPSRLGDPISLATDAVMLTFDSPWMAFLHEALLWCIAAGFYLVLMRRSAPGFLKIWLFSRETGGRAVSGASSRTPSFWWKRAQGRARLIWLKEFSSVVRSPVLRLQLVLVVALSGIFLYSVNRLPFQDDAGLRELLFLPTCGFSQLILISVATRFIFPIESVESSGAWMFRSAPLGKRDWLLSRLWVYFPPLLILNIALVESCIHAFQPDRPEAIVALLLMVFCPLGIAALTSYLGLAWQNREASQPEEMTTSPAGILVMSFSLVYVAAQISLFYIPLHEIHRYAMNMREPIRESIFAASLVAWLGIHAVTTLLPMRLAWRRMEEGG